MIDLDKPSRCKLCGVEETAGNLTLKGECALRNEIPDNPTKCKDRQIARHRHRYQRLWSLANSLLNNMSNSSEEGADVSSAFDRLRAELDEASEPGPEPEPVEAVEAVEVKP